MLRQAGVGCHEAIATYWTRVNLLPEPATDRIDQYGRLLRYVVRVSNGLDVNIRLVAVGAAAPYFYSGRRGRYANRLEALAKRARAKKLGLWRACPHTVYDPYGGPRQLMATLVRARARVSPAQLCGGYPRAGEHGRGTPGCGNRGHTA